MAETLAALTQHDLVRIVDRVHDHWFDLASINYDRKARTITIPFLEERAQLVIHNATALHIDDPEEVGHYDFNVLEYDSARHLLRLLTGVPLVFEVPVTRLDVRLESPQ